MTPCDISILAALATMAMGVSGLPFFYFAERINDKHVSASVATLGFMLVVWGFLLTTITISATDGRFSVARECAAKTL